MRGSPIPPEKVEEAKAVFARTNNYAEAARQTNLPKTTAFENIKALDSAEVEQLRIQVKSEFMQKSYRPLMGLVDLLTQKIEELKNRPNLNKTDLRELSGSIKDLKLAIENVGNTINVQNNLQVNNIQVTDEMLEKDAIEFLESKGYKITKDS